MIPAADDRIMINYGDHEENEHIMDFSSQPNNNMIQFNFGQNDNESDPSYNYSDKAKA